MWGQPRGGSIPLARTIFSPCWDVIVIGLSEGSINWELILASGSPRRRDLLREAGLSFQILSPEVEELGPGDLPPRELALANARLKCFAVSLENPEAIVIGADTVVALGGRVFGKPESLEEAAANLRLFRGRVQEVMTGVVLAHGEHVSEFVETSYVKFHDFSDETIEEYLEKVPVLDKAGGYAIQDHGEMIVERFEGDFNTIVGLPLSLVLDQLERMGFPVPPADR
jgi:septum formation protein